MKEIIEERVVSLGIAQQKMIETVDFMGKISESKNIIEQNAFESMNATDKAMNLSKEGLNVIDQLKELCEQHMINPQESDHSKINYLVEEIYQVVSNIKDTTMAELNTIHIMEKEVANCGTLAEKLKNNIDAVSITIHETAACAELILTME